MSKPARDKVDVSQWKRYLRSGFTFASCSFTNFSAIHPRAAWSRNMYPWTRRGRVPPVADAYDPDWLRLFAFLRLGRRLRAAPCLLDAFEEPDALAMARSSAWTSLCSPETSCSSAFMKARVMRVKGWTLNCDAKSVILSSVADRTPRSNMLTYVRLETVLKSSCANPRARRTSFNPLPKAARRLSFM